MILEGDCSFIGVWDNDAHVWRQTNSDRVVTPEEVFRYELEESKRANDIRGDKE
jgi:hypothetical protein